MGRFFFVEAKSFEFVIEPWGNSLRLSIVERGIGYLHSIFLEKGAVVWLLSMLGGSVGGGASSSSPRVGTNGNGAVLRRFFNS